MRHWMVVFAITAPTFIPGLCPTARWKKIGRLCCSLASCFLLLASVFPGGVAAQTNWERYPANPVFDIGTEESGEEANVAHPTVLFDGSQYHLWYLGDNGSQRGIGYARSTDGLVWKRYPGNPVLRGGFGEKWDGGFVSQPAVLYDGVTYRMWYGGYDGTTMRIGYATSSDGVVWEKHAANPVLTPGASGRWDDTGVSNPTVLYDGTRYQMWYTGYDGTSMEIGSATSADGVVWEKYIANPVLAPGTKGAWDVLGVSSPAVVFSSNTYQMWYAGYDGTSMRIGYATSADGIVWEKHAANPVLALGAGGKWDTGGVSDPTVVFVRNPDRYRLWYAGYDGVHQRIGSATGQAPSTVGDASGNGEVTAYDAALILQFVVGLIDRLPVQQAGASKSIQTPSSYSVNLPQLSAKANERIHVPLTIQDARGLLAGGIRLKYDPTVLRAVEVSPSPMLNGSYWQVNTGLPGEVRFAFVTLTPLQDGGDLVLLTFDVLPHVEGHVSPLLLSDVDFNNTVPVKLRNGAVSIVPSTTQLLPNYPNPFNPGTWIPYRLAEKARVRIRIYNAQGQLVRILDEREHQAGVYRQESEAAYWDGTDTIGQRVASGIYFYQLQADGLSAIRRMIMLK